MEKDKIMEEYQQRAARCYEDGNLDECVDLTAAVLKEDPYDMGSLVVMLSTYRKAFAKASDSEARAREVAELLGKAFYDYSSLKDRLFVLRAAMKARYRAVVTTLRRTFSPEEWGLVERALLGEDGAERGRAGRPRIVLFYSGVESFDFFTDQLKDKLQKKGCEVFVLDLWKIGRKTDGCYAEDEKLDRFCWTR